MKITFSGCIIKGSRVILAVAHMDHRPENRDEDNLVALCRKRHNTHDEPKHAANRKHNALRDAGQLRLWR